MPHTCHVSYVKSELMTHVAHMSCQVRPDSPLAESVGVGDRVVALDGEDVSALGHVALAAALSARAAAPERALTVRVPLRAVEVPPGRLGVVFGSGDDGRAAVVFEVGRSRRARRRSIER
jgi:hypothetical protein